MTSFQVWIRKYKAEGEDGLKKSKKNKKYSNELKQSAVKDYLSGKASQEEICRQYKISSKTRLQQWIVWYNGHKEFKERSSAKGEIYMTKGRKTTLEERAEIVAFCIEHGKDYGLTVETYKVSYQQIYSWVKKYEEKGVNGLTDRRGKAKPENELTEEKGMRNMGKKSVNEHKSAFQLRREELGLSREDASEHSGLSPERIERIENNKIEMTPNDAYQMANAYNSPNLCNYYCSNVCVIGGDYVPEVKVKDLRTITIEMLACLNSVNKHQERFIEIACDGEISRDEIADVLKIKEKLEEISTLTESFKLLVDKFIAENNVG